jgi:hypothetical protein
MQMITCSTVENKKTRRIAAMGKNLKKKNNKGINNKLKEKQK